MSLKLDSRLKEKIEFIDGLRQNFSALDNEKLQLPQIIVVGDQSSGKSSILEAISGIGLPKGVDTVTKCPIIIQMRTSIHKKTLIKIRNEDFRVISDTKSEILKVQQKSFNNQITKEPITIVVESPDVDTLTVIDLPGCVKIQTAGSFDSIVQATREITRSYMLQENSLILCILPSNQDIATMDIINLAKECNKDGTRIIGVLTKIDRINTEEANMVQENLNNRKVPIQKGYYGLVVGEDFLKLSREDRQTYEERQFKKLNLWEGHKNRLGLEIFKTALVNHLGLLIDKTFPHLKANVDMLLSKYELEISSFSKFHGNEDLQLQCVYKVIKDIIHTTNAMLVDGKHDIDKYLTMVTFVNENKYLGPNDTRNGLGTFIYLHEKIFANLYDDFEMILKDLFHLTKSKYGQVKDLEDMMEKSKTEYIHMCNSSQPFKNIINEILDLFRRKSFDCVRKFCDIIEYMIDKVLVSLIDPKLVVMQEDVKKCCHAILDKQKDNIRNQLDFLFKSEESYFSQKRIVEFKEQQEDIKPPTPISTPNTSRIESGPMQQMVTKYVPSPIPNSASKLSITEAPETKYQKGKELKDNLVKYSNNMMLRLGDVVPKFVMLSLFRNFKDDLEFQLQQDLLKSYKSYFILSEEDDIRHKELQESIKSLKESKQLIKKKNF